MQNSESQRILVVNVNWLGDVVFAIPVFKALRNQYPAAKISCLAVPRVKEILECVPGIDEIIVYDEKGRDRGVLAKWRIIHRIRRERFDTVFLLHESWTRALMMFAAGIPRRVGYRKKKNSRFLTHPLDSIGDDVHKADKYTRVVESVGIPVVSTTSELMIPEESRKEITRILAENGIAGNAPFVVVHTSGNWDLKRWPKENWAELIKWLATELKIKVIISEGPEEYEWAHDIARFSQVQPIVFAGETNLQQLMALFEKAALVISADSGPLHIASCVSRHIIGLYGPTMPSTTGPRGKAQARVFQHDVGCNRASCYYLNCPDNVCMKAVSVDEVGRTAIQILKSKM